MIKLKMAARRRGRRIQTAGTGSSTVAPSVAEAVDILQSTEVFGNLFSSDDDGDTGKDNIIIIFYQCLANQPQPMLTLSGAFLFAWACAPSCSIITVQKKACIPSSKAI